MPGRTHRLNAADIEDRMIALVYEGDTARTWIQQLDKQAQVLTRRIALERRRGNDRIDVDPTELRALTKALAAARKAMAAFEASAQKQERLIRQADRRIEEAERDLYEREAG